MTSSFHPLYPHLSPDTRTCHSSYKTLNLSYHPPFPCLHLSNMSPPEIPTLHSKAEYLKAVMYEGVRNPPFSFHFPVFLS
jgi:hypothetical protein